MDELLGSYLQRIRALTPPIEIQAARLNRDGLVNDIVIVNDAVVFRFAKNEQSRALLVHEIRVLQFVAKHISLPVPCFESLAPDVVMYPFLRDEPLSRETILRLPLPKQTALAAQLAQFLQSLHTIPSAELTAHHIRTKTLPTRVAYEKFYADLERELFPLLMRHQVIWLNQLFAPVWERTLDFSIKPALAHGDLGPYHLLYDPATQLLSGVLDFGEASLYDPADDFANLLNGLGESFVSRMLLYYPSASLLLERARFYAANLELQWVMHGLRSDDRSWFAVHLGRARDVLPFGVTQ